MVDLYVRLVKYGYRTIEKVPITWRDAVHKEIDKENNLTTDES
jgi:hypothetical protein